MKKIIFFILLVVVIAIAVVAVGISNNNAKINELKSFNSEFEKYKGQTIYGTDVLTIINRAIDNNEGYNIEKDENELYIENDINSVKVEITLLSTDTDGNITEVTYPMESLQKAGLNDFVTNFGLISFECTGIDYNSQGRVSRIYIKQLEV